MRIARESPASSVTLFVSEEAMADIDRLRRMLSTGENLSRLVVSLLRDELHRRLATGAPPDSIDAMVAEAAAVRLHQEDVEGEEEATRSGFEHGVEWAARRALRRELEAIAEPSDSSQTWSALRDAYGTLANEEDLGAGTDPYREAMVGEPALEAAYCAGFIEGARALWGIVRPRLGETGELEEAGDTTVREMRVGRR